MKISNLVILLFSSFMILISCSGSSGGGGGGGGTIDLSFQPLEGNTTDYPVMDIWNKDLNSDGIDEVIFVGRKSQPATDASWQNFNVQIYGWNNGSFENETSTWLPGGINTIVGSEPSVNFGDFDNDGDVDIFVAPSTDMYNPAASQTIRGDSVVFVNNNAGSFSKVTLESSATWSHGSTVYDFTGTGGPDILILDYQGNGRIFYFDSSWKTLTGSNIHGSGVSVGDYLNDGPPFEVLMTDDGSTNDRAIYTFSVNLGAGTFSLTKSKDLPAEEPGYLHTIRAIPIDFDGVNGTDIITFARDNDVSGGSYVQFLQNDGAGNFSDQTSSFLSNYTGSDGGVNYQPVVLDVNNDSFNDVFLSGTDFDTVHDTTQILVNDGSNSLYTGSFVNEFAANWNAKKASTANALDSGQNQHIALGPSNNYYLITSVLYTDSGTLKAAVYATDLGTNLNSGIGALP